ncbi:Nucleoside-diphosphate-sugar epimerase [Micromonospora purpureochromogenes]|uniref:Nucleoside-diphosphate-sugar epimerase n=1 Tax=Micromonospora purpureochromogenes TaxID=47872 RepID=A0A1C4UZM3_9ACTN|nr:NAD-dependent epimerase/dehydratase family protein [Micromonospora purpureochromogenes]SCE77194.1 Nucleoside-diphosphate-sugar epimerase [Micromonospora purpureochromogenes]
MQVMVLGGTQFIGRAIVTALLDDHEVTVLNRGSRPLWDPRIRQLVADRNDPAQLKQLGLRGFDAVVDVSGTEPHHVTNVLAALPDPQELDYVFISSAAVYNRSVASPPFREDDQADGDTIWGGYGEAKAECEAVLRGACHSGLTVLRPPYVYGPHNPDPREQFLWARILAGQPVFVPGDGDTRIQFCHAQALAQVVAAGCAGQLAAGTFNVGEPASYTLREYLAILGEVAGVPPRVVPAPDPTVRARDYFPFRDAELVLDVTRLATHGVVNHDDLATGLAKTLTWFRKNGGISDEPTPQELAWRATRWNALPDESQWRLQSVGVDDPLRPWG